MRDFKKGNQFFFSKICTLSHSIKILQKKKSQVENKKENEVELVKFSVCSFAERKKLLKWISCLKCPRSPSSILQEVLFFNSLSLSLKSFRFVWVRIVVLGRRTQVWLHRTKTPIPSSLQLRKLLARSLVHTPSFLVRTLRHLSLDFPPGDSQQLSGRGSTRRWVRCSLHFQLFFFVH